MVKSTSNQPLAAARSQVIGAMTMDAGTALIEALAVNKRRGFFVNHNLAGYEVRSMPMYRNRTYLP